MMTDKDLRGIVCNTDTCTSILHIYMYASPLCAYITRDDIKCFTARNSGSLDDILGLAFLYWY